MFIELKIVIVINVDKMEKEFNQEKSYTCYPKNEWGIRYYF